LIEVTLVENELSADPPKVLRLPPITPGLSCATCAARRPLSGVSDSSCAPTVRAMTAVSTIAVAAWTVTVSLIAPTESETSTRMFTPALTCTPVFVKPLKPESVALIV
jgi:hypothetical protein